MSAQVPLSPPCSAGAAPGQELLLWWRVRIRQPDCEWRCREGLLCRQGSQSRAEVGLLAVTGECLCNHSARPPPLVFPLLQTLYKKFIKDEEPPKAFFDALGSNREYNVDLIPKFIMANGEGS